MESIIKTRKNKPAARMAERFDFSIYNPAKSETPKSWDDLPLYISTKIISNILGVSMPYIGKCIAGGELKATKKAGKWFVEKDDFKNWMQAERTGT